MITVLGVMLSFGLSTLLGYGLCAWLVPGKAFRPLVGWASPLIGTGLSAVLFFLWSLAFYPTFLPPLYFSLELLLALGLVFLARRRASRFTQTEALPASAPASAPARQPWKIGLAGVFGLAAAAYGLQFVRQTVESPMGLWDAWVIWSMRGRDFFLGGPAWRSSFSEFFHGSDYPVLLPAAMARTWAFLGQIEAIVPPALAALFAICTLGLFWAALRRARGITQGLIGALVLATNATFIYWSASQYADVPLGSYFLLAVVLLYFYAASDEPPTGLLVLLGLSTGMAAWVKNEGLFLSAGVILALLSLALLRRMTGAGSSGNWLAALRAGLPFLAGLLPLLLFLLAFKVGVAPSNYVFRQTAADLWAKLVDGDRYQAILGALGEQALVFGGWGLPFFPLLLGYTVLAGPDRQASRREKAARWGLGTCLGLVLLGYIAAYVFTTFPLEWQLKESLQRLLVQVFPGLLFLLFVSIRNPLEKVGGSFPHPGQSN